MAGEFFPQLVRTHSRRLRRELARVRVPTVVLLVAVMLTGASAASLGGLRVVRLFARTVAASSGAPQVFTSDGFTAANGTNLNGRVPLVGPAWEVDVPTFSITANQLAANGAGLVNALVQTGRLDARAEVTLTVGAAINSGIIFNDNNVRALYVLWNQAGGGRLRLIGYNGGPVTIVTVTGVGVVSPSVLRVESQANQIRVFLNGVLRINYTLTVGEVALYRTATNTRWGLIADTDSTTRFDNFRVESL